MHQASIPAGLFDSSDLEPPDRFAQDRGPVERPGESCVKPGKTETKSEFQPILTVAENYTMQNLKIVDEHLFWGFGLCDLSRAEMLPGENDQIKRVLC